MITTLYGVFFVQTENTVYLLLLTLTRLVFSERNIFYFLTKEG
jgi:hypothetical protein